MAATTRGVGVALRGACLLGDRLPQEPPRSCRSMNRARPRSAAGLDRPHEAGVGLDRWHEAAVTEAVRGSASA